MDTQSKQGYELSVDRIKKVLTIHAWGMWDKELAEKYLAEYKQRVNEISAGGPPWYVLVDYREFPAQTKEVQQIIKQAMSFAKSHGCAKQARVVPSMITSMQIKRLSQETELPENAHFQTEQEALEWLLKR